MAPAKTLRRSLQQTNRRNQVGFSGRIRPDQQVERAQFQLRFAEREQICQLDRLQSMAIACCNGGTVVAPPRRRYP
jgi:hypothetical protein